MRENNNQDRYGQRHRSGGSHQLGDSMPGTIGDSEGVLHDRLGKMPTTDEDVEVYEPGQKERENENTVDSEEEDISVSKLVERL